MRVLLPTDDEAIEKRASGAPGDDDALSLGEEAHAELLLSGEEGLSAVELANLAMADAVTILKYNYRMVAGNLKRLGWTDRNRDEQPFFFVGTGLLMPPEDAAADWTPAPREITGFFRDVAFSVCDTRIAMWKEYATAAFKGYFPIGDRYLGGLAEYEDFKTTVEPMILANRV